MNTIKKIWGTTEPLIVTPMFETHRLVIAPWSRCSYHVHQFKHNAFYVITGEVFIDLASGVHRLTADSHFTIRPGVAHQFRTAEHACVAIEMYYTEPLSTDIKRYDEGEKLR